MSMPKLIGRGLTLVMVSGVLASLLLVSRDAGAGPPVQGQILVAGAVQSTPVLRYQGRLLDPATGNPRPDGSYRMIFGLYDVPAGGTVLWSETQDVAVARGLFSTLLGNTTPLDLSNFDGRALWLGITVGTDPEATPRLPIAHVAYALHAENADTVDGQHAGDFAAAGHTHSGADVTSGTVAEARIDAAIARDSEIMPTVLGNDGSASGLDADLLDGQQASAFAAASHAHSGFDITSGIVAETRIDAEIARDAEVTDAVNLHTSDSNAHHPRYTDDEAWNAVLVRGGPGSGLDADLLDGQQASAFAAASHAHDDRYYTEAESDTRFLNVTGPDEISGSSADPILQVVQTGAGVGGYFTSSGGGLALLADGSVHVSGKLTVDGGFEAPRTRYIPITAGDLMHSMGDTVYTGDCCNGVLFPDGAQSGGSITFPLPEDYQNDSEFQLDLYLIPRSSGSGSLDFFVRFVGLDDGGWSGTGSSYTSTPVSIGSINYIHRQSFTLPGFAAGSLPELVELTIRRHPDDSYGGGVTLVGLRLAYQALR